jgi:diguanylate cyclase (GGDEF)-like protein/PAS domain S-box-containing protein
MTGTSGTDPTGRDAGTAPISLLLVEDSPGDASLVQAALADAGSYDLQWVQSVAEARAALEDDRFDCLLVDLGLPDAQGLEVVAALRAPAGEAPLVVLTGNDDEASALSAIQGGVDDYLLKEELTARGLRRAVQYSIERAKMTTKLRRAEQSARALSTIVESTGDAVFALDAHGVVTAWNRGAEDLYGYPAGEAVGRHIGFLHVGTEDDPAETLAAVAAGQTVHSLETVRRTRDGRTVDVSLTISPLHDPGDPFAGASVIARDISDRLMLESQLKEQATHDALTGLPNRALLAEHLTAALADSAATGEPVTTIFLDLDSFKAVNDARGHLAGDQLLREVARRLVSVVRASDTVARLGGDEFVILCRDTDTEGAERLARRVSDALAPPVPIPGEPVHVTASIGVAVAPPLEPDPESLLRHADAAMYEAKARGGARTQFFDVSFAERSRDRLSLADQFRTALRTGELVVHYQPILDLRSGRTVGVEALTRWQHPERGSVPPAVFVPLAEDTGLVSELDHWVLGQACRDAVVLRAMGLLGPGSRMSVNLSPRTLGDPALVDDIRRITEAEGLPAECLVLEVTETAVMNDLPTARRSLEALRELGVGVALDDFGTGYSSLSLLRQLPVSRLKIDRSFVGHVTERSDDLAIAASIVNLAGALGMETVAEGVETAEQRLLLLQLGCPLGQGYLWSRAVPIGELVATLLGTSPTGRPRGVVRGATSAPHAGPGHRAWFYRRGGALVSRLEGSVREAVLAGDPCLVISSAARRRELGARLGMDLDDPWAGCLQADTDTLLDLLATGGGGLLACETELVGFLSRLGAERRTVRVFADMSTMIWTRSGLEAIALEKVWDRLRTRFHVDLVCAYDIGREWSPTPSDLAAAHDEVTWVCAPEPSLSPI